MTTTIINGAGDISVPMSSILDALEGVLTEEERNALFAQLINLSPAGVAPGDLITAELFNQMLSDINDLMVRVAVLEGASGGPVIDRIEPEGVDMPVGSKITIVGLNFRPDDLDTQVAFGDIMVSDFFPESNETHIMVPVPVGFATLPATVSVRVISGDRQSNSVPIRVIEKVVVPTGMVVVTQHGSVTGSLEIGVPFEISWRILSQLNVEQTFALSPVVTNPEGATAGAWTAGIELSDDEVTLEPGQFEDITMTVTAPGGATGAEISLRAESTTGAFEGQAPMLPLAVGETPTVSDPRANVGPAAFVATDDLRLGNITIDSQTVQGFKMRPSKNLELPMQVSTLAQGAGFYEFEAEVEPGPQTGRWTIGTMPAGRLQIGANVTQPFQVPITSSATVDTTTVSYILVTANCYETNGASSPKFTSFERMPIVGKS